MELQTYTYHRTPYYVDYRLKQFRSVPAGCGTIRFHDFDSDYGDRILASMIRKDQARMELLNL